MQMVIGGVVLYDQAPYKWNDWSAWTSLWTDLSYIAITAISVAVCVTVFGGYAMVLAMNYWRRKERERQEADERRLEQVGQEAVGEFIKRLQDMPEEERLAEMDRWLNEFRNSPNKEPASPASS